MGLWDGRVGHDENRAGKGVQLSHQSFRLKSLFFRTRTEGAGIWRAACQKDVDIV
jgi:hypothetical protein